MSLIHWPLAPILPEFGQHNLTGVPLDELAVGICAGIALVVISLIIILPSYKISEKLLFASFGAFLSLFVLVGILLGQYGLNWSEDKLVTRTYYRAGSNEHFVAEVGIRMGLHGFNVTVQGIPRDQYPGIDYNDHFSWEWHQHREGFSEFAGQVNQDFRAAQYKGLPYPTLWVAEYFVLDGEEILWGRYYRSAGFYVHSILWFSLRCWILATVLAFTNVKYSGYFYIMTAFFVLLGNLVYITVINTPMDELKIPFEDGVLYPRLGWTFYLNLACGIVSTVLGVLLLVHSKYDRSADKSDWFLKAQHRALTQRQWEDEDEPEPEEGASAAADLDTQSHTGHHSGTHTNPSSMRHQYSDAHTFSFAHNSHTMERMDRLSMSSSASFYTTARKL